jgi:beta-1,4-mannosyl-glycoprotein beta-1,4-N-acetylglucosaminyltransferase
MLSLKRSKVFVLFVLLLLTPSLLLLFPSKRYQLHNLLSYATRPLWDHPDGPHQILPHLYYEGMPMDASTCALHGWKARENGENVVVLDAVLMSSELDLLQVRLHELDPVVERFFIVESNTTFTGLPKETYFASNRERFREFEDKIEYHLCVCHLSFKGQAGI